MENPTLIGLPSELIANVFRHLDDVDIFAARVASRHLERASFSLFAKRFFRKKGYMITTPSLQVLKSVAANEELRPYVQHVWFNPDCFTFGSLDARTSSTLHSDFEEVDTSEPEQPEDCLEQIHVKDSTKRSRAAVREQERQEAYSECIKDYQRLLHSDEELADQLTEAFSTLPNLKAIGMRRSDQHNPWGWSRIKEAIGLDPRELGDIPDTPSVTLSGPTQLFIALMKALCASEASIQRLYTDAIEIDDISLRILPREVVRAACQSVLYLEINATKRWLFTVPTPHSDDYDPFNPAQHGAGLAALLSSTPKLRELGLMIFPDRKQSHLIAPQPFRPESWRDSYPYKSLTQVANITNLSHLRRIKLEKFTVSPSVLISLLQSSASHLTSIKLRHIRLMPEAKGQSSDPDTDKPWKAVFAFLASSCPKLSYLLMYHLLHSTGSLRFKPRGRGITPQDPDESGAEEMEIEGGFVQYEHLAVEVGTPHSDPDLQGPERRAEIKKARKAVAERVQVLVHGHWYGDNLFTYSMDDGLWHTDTSDEEW